MGGSNYLSNVLQIDVSGILECFRDIATAPNEETVRVIATRCIEDKILKPLGITQYGKYEYLLVSGARVDALYGHVIVEFKKPGKLSSQSETASAKEQVVRYIMEKEASEDGWERYLGVIISDKIAFVRYNKARKEWVLMGPYDVTVENIIKLIEAFRGLHRKPLEVEELLRDFGSKSAVARKAIVTLYQKLLNPRSERTKLLFEDWMRLFKQATGYDPARLKELPHLVKEYGLTGNVNFDAFIFAIQTYYAFIMKLLAAEVVSLYSGGKLYKSYIAELEDAYMRSGSEGLGNKLKELESGGIFIEFGIMNFLEGDYFSWYLDEMDDRLASALAEIVRRLADYEPATPQLKPEYARDLLKRLYQGLLPRDIRHNLGEYYTPDWLADLLLDEVGLTRRNLEEMGKLDPTKPLNIRVLDPACGSGTFLVRYIVRLLEYAREHFLEKDLVKSLIMNVVGYDLNPLAVLAARTNYLLLTIDLFRGRGVNIEIPIYLADSLMVEKRSTLTGVVYVLKTVAGEFQLPSHIVEKGLLPLLLSVIANALRNRYKLEIARKELRLIHRDISENDLSLLEALYKQLLKLEEEGKNGVWVSIIRNAFAPLLKGKFDYVIGNPPWVNWENLPEDFREASKDLWEDAYGLVGRGAGFKRDLSMLFLARCFDLYLKKGGKLGFLIPFTVFKTQAGTGFRRFLATKTRIHVVHDLVTLYPFEGAVNRTSAVVVEKVCELNEMNEGRCPGFNNANNSEAVRHVIWVNKTGKPVPADIPLKKVLRITERYEAVMVPTIEKDASSQWMQVTREIVPYVRKIIALESPYTAHAGVLSGLNQVYFVQTKGRFDNGLLLITNPSEPGQKKKVKQVEVAIEPHLVYPLIRGRDIKRWYVDYKQRYVIVPHDPETGRPLPENVLIEKYPRTYSYLSQYKSELMKRPIKPFLSPLATLRKAKNEAEGRSALKRLEENFFILDNVGSYTFAPYKVVWKRIAGSITGKAVSFACAVVEPLDDKHHGVKPIISDDTTILIETGDPDEAHYIAGVLNSLIVRTLIASYTYELGQETHIVNVVKVPKFEPQNPVHRLIAELSQRAHKLSKCIHEGYAEDVSSLEKELKLVEDELNRAVARLYGVPERALYEFQQLLDTLAGAVTLEENF